MVNMVIVITRGHLHIRYRFCYAIMLCQRYGHAMALPCCFRAMIRLLHAAMMLSHALPPLLRYAIIYFHTLFIHYAIDACLRYASFCRHHFTLAACHFTPCCLHSAGEQAALMFSSPCHAAALKCHASFAILLFCYMPLTLLRHADTIRAIFAFRHLLFHFFSCRHFAYAAMLLTLMICLFSPAFFRRFTIRHMLSLRHVAYAKTLLPP